MIDIENKVLSVVREAVLAQYPTASVYGEYVEVPASFPCVTVTEDTNYTYVYSKDDTVAEHHADVQYAINVYSNKTKGKKAECKDIIALVDSEFRKLGFTRIMLNPIQNMNDATIYRMYGRYRGEVTVDADGNYLVYRR